MPPKKIELPISHEELKKMYTEDKMSATDIKVDLEKRFTNIIPLSRISSWISKLGIARSLSESTSLARRELDYDKSFETDSMIEYIDGFILGDGGINKEENQSFGIARYQCSVKEKEFGEYLMAVFKDYDVNYYFSESSGEKSNNIHIFSTHFHPDIYKQHQRWYTGTGDKNHRKQPPEDVRITPKSIMLWYLGDGCLIKHDSGTNEVRFATCSFEKEKIENILIPKMEKLGLSDLHVDGDNKLIIRRDGIRKFFNLIGTTSPVKCYQYKFDVDSWFMCYSMHEAADLINFKNMDTHEKRYSRLSYLVKSGFLNNITRSPGGGKVMFSNEQLALAKEEIEIEV